MTDNDIKKLIDAMQEVFPTAEMVEKGFADMDRRFATVDKRFDQIDKRLEHIDARLDTIEHDIHEIRGDMVRRNEFEDALARIK